MEPTGIQTAGFLGLGGQEVIFLFIIALLLFGGKKLPDAEFAAIEKAIGREGIAEVLVLIGYYTSVALGMKVHEVPIPPA